MQRTNEMTYRLFKPTFDPAFAATGIENFGVPAATVAAGIIVHRVVSTFTVPVASPSTRNCRLCRLLFFAIRHMRSMSLRKPAGAFLKTFARSIVGSSRRNRRQQMSINNGSRIILLE
jgi:hypothetical protein